MSQYPARQPSLDAHLAVRSYFGDPDWMFKTGIGGVLNAAAMLVGVLDMQRFLFVPIGLAFAGLVVGYLLRAARSRQSDPAGKLPDWNQWGDLFFSGLNWIATQFALGVLTAIPIATILIIASFVLAANAQSPIGTGVTLVIVGTAIFAILMFSHLVMSYLMVNVANEEKLASGFAVHKVIRHLVRSPRQLLTAWVLAFQLQVMAVIIPVLTVLGTFLIPSTFFAAQLVGMSILAQAWNSSEEAEKLTAQPLS